MDGRFTGLGTTSFWPVVVVVGFFCGGRSGRRGDGRQPRLAWGLERGRTGQDAAAFERLHRPRSTRRRPAPALFDGGAPGRARPRCVTRGTRGSSCAQRGAAGGIAGGAQEQGESSKQQVPSAPPSSSSIHPRPPHLEQREAPQRQRGAGRGPAEQPGHIAVVVLARRLGRAGVVSGHRSGFFLAPLAPRLSDELS